MKQFTNKILFTLLVLLLCVGMLAVPAAAESYSGSCGEALSWSLENGVLTISGTGPMDDYSQRNPAPWQSVADSVQSLRIQEGVTTVGDRAFYHCVNMTDATLPESLLTVGASGFADCYALRRVNLPNVQVLGESSFYACTSLVNLVLPNTLTTIADQAFYRCKSLGGITIPASVTEFGRSTFTYCDKLVYVRILAPITVLPAWSFYGCELLAEVYLPTTVAEVEGKALSQCPELTYVTYAGTADIMEQIDHQLHEEVQWPQGSSTKSEVTYQENPGSVITTTTNIQTGTNDLEKDEYGTTVDATITDDSGWNDVTQTVNEELSKGNQPTVNIVVNNGDTIPADALAELTQKDVDVNIQASSGDVQWQVILKDQTDRSLQGEQDLSAQIKPLEDGDYSQTIGQAQGYQVSLGQTTMNSTLMIPVGKQNYNQVATLYAVHDSKLTKLSSVLVDYDGLAAFCLAGTEKGEYVVALNVAQIPAEEVRIPQKLSPQYDITYGATLTDSQGNQYVLTGRVNKLGISLGTLIWITVAVLAGTAVVVGVVMVTLNKRQNSNRSRGERRR